MSHLVTFKYVIADQQFFSWKIGYLICLPWQAWFMAQFSHIFADFDEVSLSLRYFFRSYLMILWNLLDSTNVSGHLCIILTFKH